MLKKKNCFVVVFYLGKSKIRVYLAYRSNILVYFYTRICSVLFLDIFHIRRISVRTGIIVVHLLAGDSFCFDCNFGFGSSEASYFVGTHWNYSVGSHWYSVGCSNFGCSGTY